VQSEPRGRGRGRGGVTISAGVAGIEERQPIERALHIDESFVKLKEMDKPAGGIPYCRD